MTLTFHQKDCERHRTCRRRSLKRTRRSRSHIFQVRQRLGTLRPTLAQAVFHPNHLLLQGLTMFINVLGCLPVPVDLVTMTTQTFMDLIEVPGDDAVPLNQPGNGRLETTLQISKANILG